MTTLAFSTILQAATMPDTRKKLRLRAAAQRLGIQATYLSRIAKPGHLLERSNVTVIRYPGIPDVVEFYEDELIPWWQARHPEWSDPEQTS